MARRFDFMSAGFNVHILMMAYRFPYLKYKFARVKVN